MPPAAATSDQFGGELELELDDVLAAKQELTRTHARTVVAAVRAASVEAATMYGPSDGDTRPGEELPTARAATIGRLGAIAQLGERLLCKQEVTGSIPVGSIQRLGRFQERPHLRWFGARTADALACVSVGSRQLGSLYCRQ